MIKYATLGIIAILFFNGCNALFKLLERDAAEEISILGDIYQVNEKVRQLQEYLKALDYNPGFVDGKLGQKTREAIKKFQQAVGINPTGYVNKKTWSLLEKLGQRMLMVYKNVTIEMIQQALKQAGYDPGPIDGKLGPITRKAIMDFQKAVGLKIDGKPGPQTWEKLLPYYLDSKKENNYESVQER